MRRTAKTYTTSEYSFKLSKRSNPFSAPSFISSCIEKMSPKETALFDATIEELRPLLCGFPKSIPLLPGSNEHARIFRDYAGPNREWVENAGEWAAVNRDLEVALKTGYKVENLPCGARLIRFPERGAALEGAIDALVKYGRLGGGGLPLLWAKDLLASAKHVYTEAGLVSLDCEAPRLCRLMHRTRHVIHAFHATSCAPAISNASSH